LKTAENNENSVRGLFRKFVKSSSAVGSQSCCFPPTPCNRLLAILKTQRAKKAEALFHFTLPRFTTSHLDPVKTKVPPPFYIMTTNSLNTQNHHTDSIKN